MFRLNVSYHLNLKELDRSSQKYDTWLLGTDYVNVDMVNTHSEYPIHDFVTMSLNF